MSIKRIPKVQLPEDVLSKRNLPLKPDPLEFFGRYIKVLPIDIERDSKDLYEISNGSAFTRYGKSVEAYEPNDTIWRFTGQRPPTNLRDFTNYLKDVKDLPDAQFFCIFDAIDNYQIGVCAYRNNEPEHLKMDIGFVWLSPIAQGTMAATELCYLLLNHVFEIGYRRIVWYFTRQHIKSYKLVTKVGFLLDTMKKKWQVVKDFQLDITFFRMLDFEWPEKKLKLEELLYQN